MRPLLLFSVTPALVAAFALGVPLIAARSAGHRTAAVRPLQVEPPAPPPQLLGTIGTPAFRPLLPPRLIVTGDDGKEQTMGLTAVGVRAEIAGPLAQTSLTLTFRNDTSRPLEGNLDFPLPENAVLTGYALDNHGIMVDGVPVEKHEARQIFEAEERKGVDPGLIEQTSGNNFRTRIYPLLAHSTRTVRVTYVTDLHAVNGDLIYTVPLRWNQTIPNATFSLSVSGGDLVAPELTFGGRDLLLPFTPIGGGGLLGGKPTAYTMQKTLENANFADDLTIRLPGMATQGQTAVETTPTHGTFFAIADAPPTAPTPPVSGLSATGRLHIGVVWDASVSRLHSDTTHELQLLSDALHGTKDATVDVTILRNVAEAPRRFVVTNGDTRALTAFLRDVPDDGGTDLSAIHLTRGSADFPITAYLLFTDGLDTMNGDPPAAVEAPVYAITTDPRANHALLRGLSERSGGAYLNLAERSDPEAVAALGRTPYSLLGVTVSGGETREAFPPHAQPIQGRVTVTGRLMSPQATVTLVYGYQNLLTGSDQVTGRRTVTLRQSDAAPGDGLVARFWARQKAAVLAQQPERNHDALIAVGKDFDIVTPATSLLVLDTLQQYIDYGIEPPASLPDIRNAWDSQRATHQRDDKQARTAKLDDVLRMWREKVEWYEHPVPPRPAKPRAEVALGRGMASQIVTVAGDDAAAPLMPAMATTRNQATVSDGARPRPTPVPQNFALHYSSGGAAAGAVRVAGMPAPHAMARAASAYYVASEVRATGLGVGRARREDAAKASVTTRNGESVSDALTPADETVTIKPWTPDTPYLAALKAAGSAGAYEAYLRERKRGGYENSPAFYLDCAEYLIAQGQNALGVRVLTSILDLRIEQPSLIRITAHRLVQLGCRDAGIRLFEQAKQLRPEEPQSYRDLALALADRADDETAANPAAAVADDNRALTLLNEVVTRPWDGRFPEIETIALMEASRILTRAHANPAMAARLSNPIDSRLTQNLPCDLRIILTWNTDETDQDLWVTEPTGEKCYYQFTRTRIGGRISHDFTQGYGPEEYLLRKSVPGKYTIQTNYYGQHSPEIDGGTTIQATVITNWGRPTEKRQYLTVRVNQAKDVVDIGSVVR